MPKMPERIEPHFGPVREVQITHSSFEPVKSAPALQRKVAQAFCAACHVQHSKPEMHLRRLYKRTGASFRSVAKSPFEQQSEVWVCNACIEEFDANLGRQNLKQGLVNGLIAVLAAAGRK